MPLLAVFLFAACDKKDKNEVGSPEITSFSPTSGTEGTTVTIQGKHFSETPAGNMVKFNGVTASVSSASKTELTVTLPPTATTGKITVTANNRMGTSTTDFIVTARLTISTIVPEKAKETEVVTINGASFSNVAAENTVKFGTVTVSTANIEVATPTQLKVRVPAGVATGGVKVSVTVNGQSTESIPSFFILPSITSYMPSVTMRNSIITVNGQNIALDAKIFLGAVELTAEAGRTATEVKVKVPTNATSSLLTIKQADVVTEVGKVTVKEVWSKINNGLSTGFYNGVSFTLNNKLYLGLGHDASSTTYQRLFEVFDPQNNTWTNGPSLPTAMAGRRHAVVIVHESKAYIGLGETGTTSLQDWWQYDPSKTGDAAWKQLTAHPTGNKAAVGFSADGSIYVGLGFGGNDIYKFNPLDNAGLGTWTPKATHSDFLHYAASFVINNVPYFGAGVDQFGPTSNFYQINNLGNTPATISITASIPLDASSPTAFSYNTKGYVIVNNSGKFYEYNPVASTKWAEKASLPSYSSVGGYQAVVINNMAYAVLPSGEVYEYPF